MAATSPDLRLPVASFDALTQPLLHLVRDKADGVLRCRTEFDRFGKAASAGLTHHVLRMPPDALCDLLFGE